MRRVAIWSGKQHIKYCCLYDCAETERLCDIAWNTQRKHNALFCVNSPHSVFDRRNSYIYIYNLQYGMLRAAIKGKSNFLVFRNGRWNRMSHIIISLLDLFAVNMNTWFDEYPTHFCLQSCHGETFKLIAVRKLIRE